MSTRASFALAKLGKALKYMITSGLATYFLTGLVDIVAEIDMDRTTTLAVYLVINSTLYAIEQYRQGEEN